MRAILLFSKIPNHKINKGTQANEGTAFKACIVGSNKFLKVGDIPVIIPKIEATKPPSINPLKTLLRVIKICERSSPS